MDDVMPATDKLLNDVRLRGVSRDVALDRVVSFAQQFGEAHLTLACHAAFPLVLTPDLLYRLWANFVPQAPWTVIADVLLSPLCREVGHELYEMDVGVRNLLLKELEEDERFGQQRLNELADFLTDYVAEQLYSDDPDLRDLAQAQRWTALAYTRPGEAAYELALTLSGSVQEGGMDLLRVTLLAETFAEPLAEFGPLLIYTRGIANWIRGDLENATIQFNRVLGAGHQIQVAGVSLPVPEPILREAKELKTKISRLEEKQPLHVPFANREDEMELILSSLAPPYYLLDAPASYGKTEMMTELKRRLEGQGWVCAYAPVSERSSLLDLSNALAQELGVSLKLDTDARRLGANLASALNRQRKEDITQQGLVLLIDLSKGPSLPVKDVLDKFIPGIQENLRILDFFATKHNRFRVVIAGRFLAGREEVVSTTLPLKVLKLTPFDYDIVQDTARNYLAGHSKSGIAQISAHAMHLTGGHPGCIARMLEMYRESGLSPDDFPASYAEDIQGIVWREVENIRNDIRPELRKTLDDLSVFRYFDYGLLRRLISGDPSLIQGYDSEYNLADELGGTYLLDWKGRFLRDDTTRRLLAIRLRYEVGTEEFSARCRQAQALCADYLREPTIQMPEMWAIEFMFQFLQQHAGAIQTFQRRREIRQSFFGEVAPNALRLLANSRDVHVEQNALKRALEVDWEFRFTVNYFLRSDEYDDEPYRELQRRMDDFLSGLRG